MRLSLLFKQKKVGEVSCLNLKIWKAKLWLPNKGSDQKANIVDKKKTDRSRASNRDNRDNLWCIYCQKPRHKREKCRFNQEEIENLRALLGTLEKPSSKKSSCTCSLALLGATDHMTHSSHQFNNYNPCPSQRKIAIANGSFTTIAGVADVQISPTLTFRNALYVPKLGKMIGLAEEQNKLYYLETLSESSVSLPSEHHLGENSIKEDKDQDSYLIDPSAVSSPVFDPAFVPYFSKPESLPLKPTPKNRMTSKVYSRKKVTVPKLTQVQKSEPPSRNEVCQSNEKHETQTKSGRSYVVHQALGFKKSSNSFGLLKEIGKLACKPTSTPIDPNNKLGEAEEDTMQLLSPADKDPPAADPLQTIQISEEGTHLTYISSLLTPEETRNIQDALRQSHDVFAWAHSDMKGIHPSIVSHRLNVLPTARLVRQRVRRFHPDRQKIIREEIEKFLEAEFIREVEYPDWLANVVVVPKKEGKWRVCVDYTNLNNACPKDSFPLPQIDQIVDSTARQGMLSFLDAFSGYHQIPMSPADEEKTAF
ncbi:Transposon Ty3-I Gag-Pol polyprotein [Vitis vinifera]|uniref:Transposon Ty3-I Gag-Pol polyprotein n=1 Tax=Vitis vinifera TaxID=29760 RepID=A0A438CCU9_VITVI|nr:Transposon Ty3-I Gag-Pol polyprotein [Vitis vinifera]